MMGFNKIEYLWLMEYLSQQRYDELAAESVSCRRSWNIRALSTPTLSPKTGSAC